jgi:hypothetical protein
MSLNVIIDLPLGKLTTPLERRRRPAALTGVNARGPPPGRGPSGLWKNLWIILGKQVDDRG